MADPMDTIDVRFPALHDPVWLRRRHVEDGAEVGELAREVGCSEELVRRALRRHQVLRPAHEGPAFEHDELNDEAWLRRAHSEEGLTGADIAERVGCGVGEAYRALRAIGISAKSPQRAGR